VVEVVRSQKNQNYCCNLNTSVHVAGSDVLLLVHLESVFVVTVELGTEDPEFIMSPFDYCVCITVAG
jgi:hypothetical protein